MYYVYSFSHSFGYLKRTLIDRQFIDYDESKISETLYLDVATTFVFQIETFDDSWPMISQLFLFKSPKLHKIRIMKHCKNNTIRNINLILYIIRQNPFIESLEYSCPDTSTFTLSDYKIDPVLNAISNDIFSSNINLMIKANFEQYIYVINLIKHLITNTTIEEVSVNYPSPNGDDAQQLQLRSYCDYIKEFYRLFLMILDYNTHLNMIFINYSVNHFFDPRFQTEIEEERKKVYQKLLHNRKNRFRKSKTFLQLVSQHLTF